MPPDAMDVRNCGGAARGGRRRCRCCCGEVGSRTAAWRACLRAARRARTRALLPRRRVWEARRPSVSGEGMAGGERATVATANLTGGKKNVFAPRAQSRPGPAPRTRQQAGAKPRRGSGGRLLPIAAATARQ
ncbi:hypothetical protein PVAP13_5NG497600 [Panicum virgatum]|uniref:Uncharacterized protein n=1 Tax=Panicum virgatum TaxID=38727 RepID=A0A8T0S539_PANVG|nr:hypothetical protein PVAP13_5NG497600 [Panicum virgatum]